LNSFCQENNHEVEKSSTRSKAISPKGNILNLVLLDIDGTLTQSYEYDREIFGIAIAEVLGVPPIDADLNGYTDKTSLGVTMEAIQRLSGRSSEQSEIEQVKLNVLLRLNDMYRESPRVFSEVPGASLFLERLRKFNGGRIAIATGCWLSEALFKLQASGLNVDGIPMATSDDSKNRLKIMEIAVGMAGNYYGCSSFDRVVYVGDGPWDLQTSRSLGYKFVGIGPRVETLKDLESFPWHQDLLDTEAVLASLTSELRL
jgi:phosphoglycolate phosphatase-like HAD superfamily hydrolase